MTPISPAELLSIQAAANALLSLPCTIQRKTMTPDTMGQETETWTTVSSPGLLCGMRIPSPAALANWDFVIGSLSSWEITLPVGTNVQHQDHIIVSGQTLVVQVIQAPRSYPALLTVLASEVH